MNNLLGVEPLQPAEPQPLPTPRPTACTIARTCKVQLAWLYSEEERMTITGFRVYWGNNSKDSPGFTGYPYFEDTNDLTYIVDGLGYDNYYFSVVAYKFVNGVFQASPYSNEVHVFPDNFIEASAGKLSAKMY